MGAFQLSAGKCLALVLVVFGLWVVVWQIRGVVTERQQNRDQAVASVARSWGGEQTVEGPILIRRCTVGTKRAEGAEGALKDSPDIRIEHFAPEHNEVRTANQVQIRKRGIYQAHLFEIKATAKARFAALPAVPSQKDASALPSHCDLNLALAVSDQNGLRQFTVSVAGKTLNTRAGSMIGTKTRGASAALDASHATSGFDAHFSVELIGHTRLNWIPAGKSFELQNSSNWLHWSYGGDHLPNQHDSTAMGSTALWLITNSMQSNYIPESHRENRTMHCNSYENRCEKSTSHGLEMRVVDPVDHYSLSDRSTKYAMLFIALTFSLVMLFEMLANKQVHPMQYGMVGLALCVFFLLLISLSEFHGFAFAYAAAAGACTLLLTIYSKWVLGGNVRALGFGAAVAVQYASVYVIMNLYQAALLMGSTLLFAALATLMIATRNVNWYGSARQTRSDIDADPRLKTEPNSGRPDLPQHATAASAANASSSTQK